LAAFAATVPLALAALFGGAIVDRVGARRASIGSDVLAGCAIASIPALHATGRLQYWHVLALASAVGAFDGPGRAARLALIPDLAARVDLPLERANGLARLAEHTGYVMGAPIGGALIATVGAPGALWIDAGSFAASALAVALTVPAAREKAPSSGYLRDLAAGVKFVAGERVLRTLLAMASAGSFSIAPLATVLLPVYARDRLGGAGAYAATVAAYGVGGVLGALTFGAIGTRVSRRAVYVGTWVVAAAASLVLVALPSLTLALLTLVILGAAAGAIVPLEQTVWEERTPPQLRARVFAIATAIPLLTDALAFLVAGVVVGTFGLRTGFLMHAIGDAILLAAAIMLPAIRHLDPDLVFLR